jgi:hypothetical protein
MSIMCVSHPPYPRDDQQGSSPLGAAHPADLTAFRGHVPEPPTSWYDDGMSETEIAGRDAKSGQFIQGYKGGGRPKGARSKLTTAFLEDLRVSWNEVGAIALKQCAEQDPAGYCRIVASLLPRTAEIDIDMHVMHNAGSVLEAYRIASDLLGTDPAAGLRRLKRVAPLIDHE